MVILIVRRPPRSGKTHLVHAIAQLELPAHLHPTTAVSHASCTIKKANIVLWDTPPCTRGNIPDLAFGIVRDCDMAIVCYDGRQCWSPSSIVKAVGSHRCVIYVKCKDAFNLSLAVETFDFAASALGLVPVCSDVNAMTQHILRTARNLTPCAQADERPLMGSV